MAVLLISDKMQRKLSKIMKLTDGIYLSDENKLEREQEIIEYGLDMILDTFKEAPHAPEARL